MIVQSFLAIALLAPPGHAVWDGPVLHFGQYQPSTSWACQSVGFSRDGSELIAYGELAWIRYDLATGYAAGHVPDPWPTETKARLRPGPGMVTLIGRDQVNGNGWGITVLDPRTGEQLATSKLPEDCFEVDSAENPRWLAVENKQGFALHAYEPGKGYTARYRFPKLEGLASASAAETLPLFAFMTLDKQVSVRGPDYPPWDLPPQEATRPGAMAMHPAGTLLAVAKYGESDAGVKFSLGIDLWDTHTLRRVRHIPRAEWSAEYPNRVVFSPDGRRVFAGDGSWIRGWWCDTGRECFAVNPGPGWTGRLQISPTGQHIAVAYPTGPRVWNVETQAEFPALRSHTTPVWELVTSPTLGICVTAAHGHDEIMLWNMQTGASQGSIRAEYARPSDPEDRIIPGRIKLSLSPDGEHLATVNTASGAQGPIRVWHLPSGRLLWQEPVKERFPPEVGFTRDGLLVMEGAQPVLKDTQTGQVRHRYPAGISERLPVISPRGDLMAYETRSGETAIFQLPEGTILDRCSGAPLRFTPSGKTLAVAPDTYSIRHRDWQTRTDTRGVFLDREGPVMILSPDATLVAITTDEGHFPIHDARTGQLLAVCASPQQGDGILLPECDQIQFSPDGRTLVACYRNGVIRAWESLTGHLLGEYEQESGELKTAAFSPDGRRFLTNAWGGRVSGTMIGWDLTMGATQSLHRPDAGEWQYLLQDLRGEARRARWAIDRVARDPERALAWIDALRQDPRPEELKRYRLALEELDARQYTTREGAFALLWEAGWRVERELRAALEQSPSQHLRVEITRLLDHPDPRPTRIVHLLEVIGSPEAMRRIQELAADPRDLPFQREARRARLARFPTP